MSANLFWVCVLLRCTRMACASPFFSHEPHVLSVLKINTHFRPQITRHTHSLALLYAAGRVIRRPEQQLNKRRHLEKKLIKRWADQRRVSENIIIKDCSLARIWEPRAATRDSRAPRRERKKKKEKRSRHPSSLS
jgi:hypothetical protein